MTETIGNAHFCEKVKHKNINRRIEWVHYFFTALALDSFASQIYLRQGIISCYSLSTASKNLTETS